MHGRKQRPDLVAGAGVAGSLKDKLVSLAAGKALAHKLREWCDMLKLEMDSQAKTLTVEALPKGELEPIRVELRGYSLVQEGTRTVLEFESLTTSREWLTRLAETMLPEKRLVLPEGAPVELLKVLV